jgi:hypothetical protein
MLLSICLGMLLTGDLRADNTKSADDAEMKVASANNEYAKLTVNYAALACVSTPKPLLFKVENVGKAPIYYDHYYAEWSFDVEAFDAKGKRVPLTRYGTSVHRHYSPRPNAMAGHGKQLDPGQSYGIDFDVQRIFDLSIPGTYTLKVRNSDGFDAQVRPGSGALLESGSHDGGTITRCDLRIEGITFKVTE